MYARWSNVKSCASSMTSSSTSARTSSPTSHARRASPVIFGTTPNAMVSATLRHQGMPCLSARRPPARAAAFARPGAWRPRCSRRDRLCRTTCRCRARRPQRARCGLWERLLPEWPSFEMLDERMQAGYAALKANEVTRACDLWLDVWEGFKLHLTSVMIRIHDVDTVFHGTEMFVNWCQEFEHE